MVSDWLFFQLLPLVFVVLVSMLKAAFKDLMKHKEDNRRNQQLVNVWRDGGWHEIVSVALAVGDIIRITDDAFVPSDLLYVGSSEPSNLCYYRETNLNGETAVKTMQCFPIFQDEDVIETVTNRHFIVDVGPPDRDLTRSQAISRALTRVCDAAMIFGPSTFIPFY
jgi:P-type E1-E2 ATPase